MEGINVADLSLNPDQCTFAGNKIHFWGMIFTTDGMQPDPVKVDALDFISAPTNKDELISFLCMMCSNSGFIKHFVQKAAPLRELTHKNANFE